MLRQQLATLQPPLRAPKPACVQTFQPQLPSLAWVQASLQRPMDLIHGSRPREISPTPLHCPSRPDGSLAQAEGSDHLRLDVFRRTQNPLVPFLEFAANAPAVAGTTT